MYRTLISLDFLICIPLLRAAWIYFQFIIFRRNVLKIVWQQSRREHVGNWTNRHDACVGTSTCRNDLFDFSDTAAAIQTTRRQPPPPSPFKKNVVMQNLEAGQSQAKDFNAGTSTGEATEADESGRKLPFDSTNLCPSVDVPSLAARGLACSPHRRVKLGTRHFFS